MTYQALYRKWRPKSFAEIVGQQHVTRTLQNALSAGRISHAYLFCGSRGTGKTTTAKVLAKVLNCIKGPSTEPCNSCDNCLSIMEGRSMDVVEIDAASNRGIDEIRDLREKINFSPSNCRYRVYIIDEVHMLTNEAFNALLKTLEEPPAHVVFILATTEPHKVPVTILSRCQRFDFRPITEQEMISRMQEVARGAGLDVEGNALGLIARAAEGSLRDALSIMDQASSLGEGKITEHEIHGILGTVYEDVLRRMTEALLAGDIAGAIELVDTLVTEGKDLRVFARQLGAYLRNLLVEDMAFAGESNRPVISFDRRLLLYITKLLVRYEQEMRWSSQPRLLLELFVFEAVEGGGDNSVDDLALRLARLEERVERLLESRIPTGKKNVISASEIDDNKEKSGDLEQVYKNDNGGNNVNIVNDVNTVNNNVIKKEKQPLNAAAGGISLEKVKKLWPQILAAVKRKNKATYACLESSWPAEIAGCVLTLGYEEGDIAKEVMEQENNQRLLARVLSSFFKGNWTVRCDTRTERPEEWEGDSREVDFKSAMELFRAEEVEKLPPE